MLKVELKEKASNEETGKIWEHFRDYAEYKELKILYAKVSPEMAKHEQNMIEHRSEIKRFSEIISRFDEVISDKSSKQDFRSLEIKLKEEYLSRRALEGF